MHINEYNDKSRTQCSSHLFILFCALRTAKGTMVFMSINKKQIYIIFFLIFITIGSCIIFKISLCYGFLLSIILCLGFSVRNGFKLVNLLNIIKIQLFECKNLFLLILLIGATVSIWMSSGIIPTMIYYGLDYMKGMNFLFATFIFTSITSVFMGTSIGTISTVGVVFLALGKVFNVPSNIVLGTIISGAFIADKISPISGLFNLTLETIKISYKETVKSMFKTLVPVYILCGIIYFYIGTKYKITVKNSNLDYLRLAIKNNFIISPILLILPISIIIMCFLGVKILKSIFIGLICGIVVSISLQKVDFIHIVSSLVIGYKATTESQALNKILVSGGITSMIQVLLIIVEAISLSTLLEAIGIIQPIINKIIGKVNSKGDLILKTGLISSLLTIITCDQSMGIILPGRLIKDKYNELNINNTILARTISDTGTIIAPLIPWNVNVMFISIITGVYTINYIPYAILCYIFPLVTCLVGYVYKIRYAKYGVSPTFPTNPC